MIFIFLAGLAQPVLGARPPWKAGVAKILITPGKSLWMAGFGARTKPSEGTLLDIYAKALALEDRSGKRAVLVTTDLVGFPAVVARNIADQVEKQYRLPRDRLILNSSHTHSGPVLTNPLRITYSSRMSPEQIRDVDEYTRELEGKVVAVVGAALKDLRPARLSFGRSETNFAVNRRQKTERGFINGINPDGPVDHDVPLLRVDSDRGQIRGMVFGYACHNTLLRAGTSGGRRDRLAFRWAVLA
ncbi:MAG: neutral/alkaline non-lysosomal ceramidase N-terminal domain-containing protein [Acidobacteria bacterium]|nr:neutral/alkaline non-lysosomal ceramidase N-terminal domain-containing protein [Acidobacteriota bacterium]